MSWGTNDSSSGWGDSSSSNNNSSSGGWGDSSSSNNNSSSGGWGDSSSSNNNSSSGGWGDSSSSNNNSSSGGWGSSSSSSGGWGNSSSNNSGGWGSSSNSSGGWGNSSSNNSDGWGNSSGWGDNNNNNNNNNGNNWTSPFGPYYGTSNSEPLMVLLSRIDYAYNPKSPYCRFRHMFYNIVLPTTIPFHQKPKTVNDLQWNMAVQNNPDPKNLVPVQAIGFEDLKKRAQLQQERTGEHLKLLAKIEKSLSQIKQKHKLRTNQSLEALKNKHYQVSHRLLRIMAKLEVLQSRGISILPQEDEFREKLTLLEKKMKSSDIQGNSMELASRVRLYEQQCLAIRQEMMDTFGELDSSSLSLSDDPSAPVAPLNRLPLLSQPLAESSIDQITDWQKYLAKGLKHINKMAQTAMEDIEIITQGYQDIKTAKLTNGMK